MSTILGYPDWQASGNARTPALFDNPSLSYGTIPTTFATLHLPNYNYVQIAVNAAPDNTKLTATFTTAGGDQLGTWAAILANGASGVYNVPMVGDTCSLQIVSHTAGPHSIAVGVYGVEVVQTLSSDPQGVLIPSQNLAVNAGTLNSVGFSGYQGLAWIYAEAPSGAFIARLRAFDIDGTTILARTFCQNVSTQFVSAQVYIPPLICDLAIFNSTAGNLTYIVSAVAQLWAGH